MKSLYYSKTKDICGKLYWIKYTNKFIKTIRHVIKGQILKFIRTSVRVNSEFGLYAVLLNTDLFILNPLQTKRRPLYLKTQSVPRCKHFSSQL